MAGDLIKKDKPTNTMNKIKQIWSKWGGSSTVVTFTDGTPAKGDDIKKLVAYLQDGKRRSGWGGTVPTAPNNGDLIKDIFAQLDSAADGIKNHCSCNCNHCSCNCNHCSCQGDCGCNNTRDV